MASVAVMTTLLLANVLRSMLTFLVMSSKPCHRILPVSYPCQLVQAKKRKTKMKLNHQNDFLIWIFSAMVRNSLRIPSAECDFLSVACSWQDGRAPSANEKKNLFFKKLKHQVSVCVHRSNEDYYIKRAAVQCHTYQQYGIIEWIIMNDVVLFTYS